MGSRVLHSVKRSPNGIHSASQVFQRKINSITSDVSGSAKCQDNIMYVRTLAEYNKRLNQVFLKNRKSRLKLNKTKNQTIVKPLYFFDMLFLNL